jgi:peroxiredoxin
VSIDGRKEIRQMIDRLAAEGQAPGFTILSDPGHRVIDRYGLLNPGGRGWPHPTTLVIDRKGVVRWKFVEIDYKVRPTNQQILEALAKVSGS